MPLFEPILPTMVCPLFGVATAFQFFRKNFSELNFSLSQFAIVNFREYFVVMGGFKNQGGTKIPSNEIAEFRDGKWRNTGTKLLKARGGHSVVYHQHRHLVVGGKGDA